MTLTIDELEKLQATHPDYRMELVDGEVTIMSPSGYEADEVSTELAAQIRNGVRPRQLGRVTGSSAGFILPNADTRAPDVSFVKAERLRRSPRSFAELAPDLMVEVKSPTDKLTKLRSKIQDFLAMGTQVGILIDPEARCVEVYRAGDEVILLGDGDRLAVPDLLPGWEVAVADLWPLIFE